MKHNILIRLDRIDLDDGISPDLCVSKQGSQFQSHVLGIQTELRKTFFIHRLWKPLPSGCGSVNRSIHFWIARDSGVIAGKWHKGK